jgi:hypothetical protein
LLTRKRLNVLAGDGVTSDGQGSGSGRRRRKQRIGGSVGYLKRRRSRLRERRSISAAFPSECDFDALEWAFAREWTAGVLESDSLPFVRFAVRRRGVPKGEYDGVFRAAYAVARRPLKTDDFDARVLAEEVLELLQWFEENLTSHDPRAKRAVFWFRSEAVACIDRVWRLTRLLERAGFTIFIQETDAPGKVVYQDDNQIAALRPKSA